MRRLIAVLIIAGLFLGGVACSPGEVIPKLVPKLFDSLVVYGAEEQNAIEIEGNVMAVFYKRDNEQVIGAYSNAVITDNGDGTWDVEGREGSLGGVNQELVTYGLYQYQKIDKLYDEEGYELPQYLSDLDLQPITGDDLPHSEHIGKLIAVDTQAAKPATIRRWYLGQTFDIKCLVTQAIVNMWTADEINVDDWVLVSFIDEIPNTTERHVAIVTDKIYPSWQ